ncbi:TonB-dependent receptor [Sphingobium sp. EM0848]|uniref:TonB-dependent receptor n=1 Tax=Sphingobium sp. EM0848 TaxID=2743473 RepID=UPI00159C5D89|nr:TonB-dependent receptor [Sphingobium sp. EM0848]
MRNRYNRCAVLQGTAALLALAASQQAWAQQAAPAGQEPTIEEIIVTGRLRAERLQDAPLAVTALSGNTLQKQAISDVQGISKMVPLMVVGRQVSGSGASIFLRGVGSSSLSSGFDQSVALNLDGIAMTRGREIINTQYDLKQVEVLKGPQALFFGKNSTGGVVSMTTADPGKSFEAMVKAGYEFVADERYAEAMISSPLSDRFGVRFAMRASKMDGYFKNVAQANTTNGFFRQPASDRVPYGSALSGRLTLKYDADDFVATLKASGTHMKDSGVFYERRCGAGRSVPQLTLGVADPYADCRINGEISTANIPLPIASTMSYQRKDGETYDDHKSGVLSLRLDKTLDTVTLTSITGYYAYKQHDANSFSGATLGIYSGQEIKFRQFSQELRALTSFDGPFNATLGAYYAKGKLNFNFDSLVFADPVDPATGRYDTFRLRNGFTDETWSAFAELTWKIAPELELAGGARYSKQKRDSYVNQIYVHPTRLNLFAVKYIPHRFRDDNVSPQATLTWKPNQDVTLYAAYKQGFKTGGFNTSISVTPTTTADSGDFASEKAKGGEVGLRTRIANMLSFNLTGYYYDYDDLQVQVFNAVTQAQEVQNVGTLRIKGIEAEAMLDVPNAPGLQLRTAAAYNNAQYHDFLGTCYTGQTISAGCNQVLNAAGTAYQKQDLEGRTPPKAPRFSFQFGINYDYPLSDDLRLGFNWGAQYTSKYNFSDALRPDAVQRGFTRYDAGVRLSSVSAGWEVALIGRNLTNELVVTSANDMPRQGSGTGTAVGAPGDLNAIVERGREVHLQLSYRF